MFRFCKQQLGWTRPKLRDPAAADRWTWLVITAYVQLHLARDLAGDIRLPWQQPCAPGRLTPSRVRRGYRRIRQDLPVPASAPKPSRPGPGRPKGSKNQKPATRHDVGKTVKREEPKKKTRRQAPLNNKLRNKTLEIGEAMNTAKQAMANMEYVRRLLEQKQPGFAASLELAARLVERKLRKPAVASRNVLDSAAA